MNTLDEVIEAPYSPTPWEADALHYLKEYREMKEHLACLDSHTLHGDETERRYDNGNLERY